MIPLATAWVMALQLKRDAAALVMTFLLPPLIFVVLAAIFSGATGTELRLHVGLLDLSNSDSGRRFVRAFAAEPSLRTTVETGRTAADLDAEVRDGEVDVGVLVRGDLASGGGKQAGAPPLAVIGDPSRAVAVPIVTGLVQRVVNEKLPDVALSRILGDVERAGKLEPEERAFLERAFEADVKDGNPGFSFAGLVDARPAPRERLAGGPIAYYAGAVTAIFLLFAAMQGAASLLDERQAGIHARLLAGPDGMAAVVAGKFVFLTAQGLVQAALIYATARLVYGVDVLAHPLPWLLAGGVASAMAAGLALAVCASCATRQQAQLVSSFGVLMVSAVGGSMVPRYLMPPWLQSLSWLTPNAWTIEAFHRALLRDAGAGSLAPALLILGGIAAAGLAVGAAMAARQRAG